MLDMKDRRSSARGISDAALATAGASLSSIAPASARPRPVLVILHQETSTPGHVGHWLQKNGYDLDIRRPPLGDELPETLSQHSGAVVFGGPMSANDSDDYLNRERRFIETALKEDVPCLGICLGGQLMAQVLGQQVFADPEGRVEVGYYPIEPATEGAMICDWPDMMYQWHREGFDLPTGAVKLAQSDSYFPTQAFAYGASAVGIQFHPEITLAMIHRWTTKASERLALPGAKERQAHLTDHIRFEPAVAKWRDDFLAKLMASQIAQAPVAVAAAE